MEAKKEHIAIIGGGFCGMMTTVHLLENAKHPLKITIINSGYPFGKGVAYSAYSDSHLLNVTAGNMSAFPDKPTHFIDWVHTRKEYNNIDKELLARTFLPRNIYGEYLEDIWNKRFTARKPGIELNIIEDRALDIELKKDSVFIKLQSNPVVEADKAILATGNSEPRDPFIPNSSFFSHPSYFRDSWKKESTHKVLTMVDTVLGLI
jgi:uncharacterized NAD(P)/FAD-binding protein YdhS